MSKLFIKQTLKHKYGSKLEFKESLRTTSWADWLPSISGTSKRSSVSLSKVHDVFTVCWIIKRLSTQLTHNQI